MLARAPAIEILGVPVSRVTMPTAVATIEGWLRRGESHFVCACDVHSLMRARNDATHMMALHAASLVTPDGQPVVWTARLRGTTTMERVCGPDLLPAVCRMSSALGARHYFLGGAPGIADALARRMQKEQPGLIVAGTQCPPFRPLTADEQQASLADIRASGANVLWLGLGCPKQEKWMYDHRDALPGVVMIGIGAAFDFHTNRITRAPIWMRDYGLEWLHRLISEPQRLWRRYLVTAPQFVLASVMETAGQRLARARRRDD